MDYKGFVQTLFNMMSGAYIFRNGVGTEQNPSDGQGAVGQTQATTAAAMLEGVSEMIGDLPRVCSMAFCAGLLEHHSFTEDEAKQLMRQYMREQKFTFVKMYEELRKCMEDDGFFDLSGLTDMLGRMSSAAKEQSEKIHGQNVA